MVRGRQSTREDSASSLSSLHQWVALVRRGQPGRTVLPLLCALAGVALAAAAPPAPTHRELWVPEKSVAAALKTMPKAVVLTREQFDTLLRDSAAGTTADPRTPPATAILRSVRYTGTVGEKAVLIHGEFVVECLAETWAELPLELDPHWLGAVTVDGTSAAVATTDQAAMLVVRGRGRHAVTIDFAVPLTESAGSRMLTLRAPGTAEATVDLTVPEALKIASTLPFTRTGGTARFALPPGRDEFRISWMAREVPPLETAGIFQDSRFVYTLDAAQARADLSMLFHAALKDLPNSLALPVAAEAQVLAVEGSELARWSLAGDQLLVEFQAGSRGETDLRVLISLPVGEAAATVELPAPVATGIHRAAGSFSLLSHPGLRVRRVTTGALTVRDDAQAPPDLRGRPDYRGTWAFPVLLTAPSVEIERLTSRFTATLDTQITLARDAIRLTRHLAFSPRDGTLFSPRVIGLIAGEQIDSVKLADNCDAVWQPVEGGLALTTPAGTAAGQSLGVTITSSLHPAGWNQLSTQPVSLAFMSVQLPGAEKLSGYVALDFDESFRVTTPRTDGLEPRDPRQFEGKLPLTGRRAWFRLDAFQLDLAVSRRTPEFDATIALDVLPLLNTLEVEGQLTLAIAHGGLREVTVTFPAAAAEAVRWESPLLAEKTLGAEGKWTLKFHQEMSGTPHVRFHLSLPLEDKSVAGEPERRFSTQVPFPAPDAARRTDGSLVIEANSDTELAFTAQALDDLDTRRAPALDGYAPRHRLVAGYAWRGKAATLAIEGVRHKASDLATTVVDSLALDSVVSADGPQRHQALLAIRTAGAQFLDVTLPAEAKVLSVVINGLAAKPIRGPGGALRLPLPDRTVRLQLIYQLPEATMGDLARTTLPPLTLDPRIPILDTTWRIHLPEGFTYSKFDTNLTEKNAPPPTPTLAAVISRKIEAEIGKQRGAVASTLLEVERFSSVPVDTFFADKGAQSAAVVGQNTFLPTEFAIMTSAETLIPVVRRFGLVARWGLSNEGEAVERLREMTTTDEDPGTDLLRLSVRAGSSQEAADLANAITQSYIDRRKKLESQRINLAWATLTQSRKGQEMVVERARAKMIEQAQQLGITEQNVTTQEQGRYARYYQAKDDYALQQEILQSMVAEQEKARLVNLMPRSPATIHQHAVAENEPLRFHRAFEALRATSAPKATAPAATGMGVESKSEDAPMLPALAGQPRADALRAGDDLWVDMNAPQILSPPEGSEIFVAIPDPRAIPGGLRDGGGTIAGAVQGGEFSRFPAGGGAQAGGARPAMRAGLLPLEFSLPEGGRTFTFAGKYPPAPLSFQAEAWHRQVRHAWIWMLVGGLGFALLMKWRRRPIFIGLLGALTLHFAPFMAERPGWTPVANALLTGWLVAVAIVLLTGVARWAIRKHPRPTEVAHA
jgi:hypothetical protein